MKNKARQFEFSSYGFESLSKSKGRRLKVRQSDSNVRVTDSNLSWHKIQISLKRFESYVKKEEMLRAIDSNHLFSDSNPSWRTWRETEARIRISYTTIRIPKNGVIKNKTRQFESSSYGFESLSKSKDWRLKVRQSDSNFRVTDSNPSWRKIQI